MTSQTLLRRMTVSMVATSDNYSFVNQDDISISNRHCCKNMMYNKEYSKQKIRNIHLTKKLSVVS